MRYWISGILVLWLAPALAYWTVVILFLNKNFATEFSTLLNGSIVSFQLIGVALVIVGTIKMLRTKNWNAPKEQGPFPPS